MATTEEIFHDAVALPPDVRAELTERLIASLAEDISPEIAADCSGRVGRSSAYPWRLGFGARAKSTGGESAIELEHAERWLSLRSCTRHKA